MKLDVKHGSYVSLTIAVLVDEQRINEITEILIGRGQTGAQNAGDLFQSSPSLLDRDVTHLNY